MHRCRETDPLWPAAEDYRPFHGVLMRWKDRVKKDMMSLAVLSHWYDAV